MNWQSLTHLEEIRQVMADSENSAVMIFKHSTRCSISRMVLDRLERQWNNSEMESVKTYFLDLLSHRDLSNQIASTFNVEHESPQVLLIRNGNVVLHRSHMDIDYATIRSAVKS